MIIKRMRPPMFHRWNNPLADMEQRMREFQRFVESATSGLMNHPTTAGVFPLLNVNQDRDNFYVSAEIPGVDVKKIDLQTENNTLTITGERELPELPEDATYHRRERDAGQFRRAINFPTQIDSEKVKATYKHGVLMVTLAKADEAKPKQITVRTS